METKIVINGLDIVDQNRFFINEELANLPGWVRREIQHTHDRKDAIDKRITETRNKRRKMISVRITTENQSVVVATVTGFNNAQRSQNECDNSSRSSHMNVSNMGAN